LGLGAGATLAVVVPIAPRYDPRLVAALVDLDDRSLPIAEICRRLGDVAVSIGVSRPSYVHVRRLVRAKRDYEDLEREERNALRSIAGDVVANLVLGRSVDPYDVAERVRVARAS
jgi:hypothetical protein